MTKVADSDKESNDRPVLEDDIEITPEMIQAGADRLFEMREIYSEEEQALQVYRVMEATRMKFAHTPAKRERGLSKRTR